MCKEKLEDATPLQHSYQIQWIKKIVRTEETVSLSPSRCDSPCNVVHQQCTGCSPVVGTGDGTEGFLSSLFHQRGNKKKIPPKPDYLQRSYLIRCHTNTKDLILQKNFYEEKRIGKKKT